MTILVLVGILLRCRHRSCFSEGRYRLNGNGIDVHTIVFIGPVVFQEMKNLCHAALRAEAAGSNSGCFCLD